MQKQSLPQSFRKSIFLKTEKYILAKEKKYTCRIYFKFSQLCMIYIYGVEEYSVKILALNNPQH